MVLDTSLRLGSDFKSLRIHAKQKFDVVSNLLFQAHAEIDTEVGFPRFLGLKMQWLYSEFATSISTGLQFNDHNKMNYNVRAKKAFFLTSDGFVFVNIKGRCDTDKEFRKKKAKGAIEFVWSILNFQRDQDVRLKLGYEAFEKVPYLQLRENNWTLNANAKGRWNIRYDL